MDLIPNLTSSSKLDLDLFKHHRHVCQLNGEKCLCLYRMQTVPAYCHHTILCQENLSKFLWTQTQKL